MLRQWHGLLIRKLDCKDRTDRNDSRLSRCTPLAHLSRLHFWICMHSGSRQTGLTATVSGQVPSLAALCCSRMASAAAVPLSRAAALGILYGSSACMLRPAIQANHASNATFFFFLGIEMQYGAVCSMLLACAWLHMQKVFTPTLEEGGDQQDMHSIQVLDWRSHLITYAEGGAWQHGCHGKAGSCSGGRYVL